MEKNKRIMTEKKKGQLKRVKELLEKEIVTEEQSIGLTNLIESPDNENFTVAEELINHFIRTKVSEDLNEGQLNGFSQIVEFLEYGTEQAFVLKGYAGTGKTFLVKRIIEYLLHTKPRKRIAVGAPTNKAVQVLYKNSAQATDEAYLFEDIYDYGSNLVYSTIHKLLGLKETITDDGAQLFTVDSIKSSALSEYDYLIVDEVSMLDDRICNDIMKFHKKVKILFMGDPAQIPPINRTVSIPFSKQMTYKFGTYELTEIMRQKGDHPVIEASFMIRDNLTTIQPIRILNTKLNEKGHGVIHFNSKTDRAAIRPMMTEYLKSQEFTNDSDYFKIIAWKNKTVEYMNTLAREILYGKDVPVYVIGEKLIARKPVFEKCEEEPDIFSSKFQKYDKWAIIMHSSEECTILDVTVDYVDIKEGRHRLRTKMHVLTVSIPDKGCSTLNIIHEDSLRDFQGLLNEAKKEAILKKESTLWKTWFNLQKWSADITYNYAITAHKSQGSTYKNVLLLEEDLDGNRKVKERNHIKYTCYSRTSEKLFVLRENPA